MLIEQKTLKGVTQMFNVGDKVVYPMHGAGIIENIEEKNISGQKEEYYSIKMPGEVKVMVPIAKADQVGVRGIIDEETAGKVFKVLEANSTEMSMNWNKRYRDNMEKIKSGDVYEVADVVRNLSLKQKDRGLSTAEKKMLLNAKQILVSELTLVSKLGQEKVEEMIETKINTSFEEYGKIEEKAEPSIKKFIPFEG
jgi:CarD family transcriptional regulator